MFNLKQFLAMSEVAQIAYLQKQYLLGHYDNRISEKYTQCSLAGLAFRLRDEADEHSYTNALYKVYLTLIRTKKLCDTEISFQHWTQTRITAIDMIAAALEAKEQSK